MTDAHTHLDFPVFDQDRAEVVARARAAGVRRWVIAGTRPSDWDRTTTVAAQIGGFAMLGVHPWFSADIDDVDAMVDELRRRDPPGIGEIGLDAVRGPSSEARAHQRSLVRAQLALARELNRPVAFHCVRAGPELLEMVEREGLPAAGAMFHGWSGPPDQAMRAVRAGAMVSFGPLVTRTRARRVREAARQVPDTHLLVETDAPDQPLAGRGRGEPADVGHVLAELATLRGTTIDELAAVTHANASRLFRER